MEYLDYWDFDYREIFLDLDVPNNRGPPIPTFFPIWKDSMQLQQYRDLSKQYSFIVLGRYAPFDLATEID